jgi:hypothetical protein
MFVGLASQIMSTSQELWHPKINEIKGAGSQLISKGLHYLTWKWFHNGNQNGPQEQTPPSDNPWNHSTISQLASMWHPWRTRFYNWHYPWYRSTDHHITIGIIVTFMTDYKNSFTIHYITIRLSWQTRQRISEETSQHNKSTYTTPSKKLSSLFSR